MKRGTQVVTTTTTLPPGYVNILESTPEDVMGEILLYTFYNAENDPVVMERALAARDTTPNFARLIDLYIIGRVRVLSTDMLKCGAIKEAAQLLLFTGLHSLDVTITPDVIFTDGGVAKLTTLRHLGIRHTSPLLSGECLNGLSNLESLSLYNVSIDRRGFSYVPQLKKLFIRRWTNGQSMDADDFVPLSNLEELELASNSADDRLLAPLSSSLLKFTFESSRYDTISLTGIKKLTKLQSLVLVCTSFDDIITGELSSFTHLKELSITLSSRVTDEMLSGLTGLTSLNLFNCERIGNQALTNLTSLVELSLSYMRVSDAGLTGLTRLKKLSLTTYGHRAFTAKGLAPLSDNLEVITLGAYTDSLYEKVEMLCTFPNLREINLRDPEHRSKYYEIYNLLRLYPKIKLNMLYPCGVWSSRFHSLY
jgi:hypothetical protein